MTVDQALVDTAQLLQTLKDVGIVVVLLFIIILIIAVVFVVVIAFMRRSSAADAQITKAAVTNDRLANALETATTAFKGLDAKVESQDKFHHQYTQEQTKALTAVKDVITALQATTTASDTKLSQQVSDVGQKLATLITQGEETLEILRKSPTEHAAIEAQLNTLLTLVRRDPALQTGENKTAKVPVSSLPPSPVPEPN